MVGEATSEQAILVPSMKEFSLKGEELLASQKDG